MTLVHVWKCFKYKNKLDTILDHLGKVSIGSVWNVIGFEIIDIIKMGKCSLHIKTSMKLFSHKMYKTSSDDHLWQFKHWRSVIDTSLNFTGKIIDDVGDMCVCFRCHEEHWVCKRSEPSAHLRSAAHCLTKVGDRFAKFESTRMPFVLSCWEHE